MLGEDKPTFYFGAFARKQLVDPIEGDEHFDCVQGGIKEVESANLVVEAKSFGNLLTKFTGPGHTKVTSQATVTHTETQDQVPGQGLSDGFKAINHEDCTLKDQAEAVYELSSFSMGQ